MRFEIHVLNRFDSHLLNAPQALLDMLARNGKLHDRGKVHPWDLNADAVEIDTDLVLRIRKVYPEAILKKYHPQIVLKDYFLKKPHPEVARLAALARSRKLTPKA